jgi:nitrite reductase (NADH) large subunit
MEIIAAATQLYREEGFYLERIYKWTDRVGLDSIKARVIDDLDERRALYARFQHSQLHSQDDPWAERAAGGDAAEFQGIRAPMLQAAE